MNNAGTMVSGRHDERHALASHSGVLNELERHGYVMEPHSPGRFGGTICRHPSAPNLLVRADGLIELLGVQPDRGMLSQPPAKRIHWGRGLVFLTLLGIVSLIGLLIVGMIAG